jgi:hypothetical protein
LTLGVLVMTGAFLFGCEEEASQPTGLQPAEQVAPLWAAGGNLSGAIFTTTPDGGIVNENTHYQQKIEVYLDGGPGPNAPQMAAGLPDGLYVFQVTDPSGKVLLSEDPAKCRIVRMEDDIIQELVLPSTLDQHGYSALSDEYTVGKGGNAQTFPCHILDDPDGAAGASGRHDYNTDIDYGENGAIVVQLMPFLDTPNPGGVYKAWVTPLDAYLDMGGDLEDLPSTLKVKGKVVGFDNDPGFGPPRNMVKTDNFKVREQPPRLYVFKYEDLNGNGQFDDGEPELTGWKVTVTEHLGDGTSVQNDYYTPVCVRLHPGVTVDVTEELPEDWVLSYLKVDGAYEATPSQTVTLTFEPGQESREVTFGNWECIDQGGMKWVDVFATGRYIAGTDVGLEGIEIILEGVNGKGDPVYLSTFTDENGRYLFECIEPGDYTVREVCPEGWTASFPRASDDCSAIYERPGLQSGDTPDDADFGNFQTVELRVYKYFDGDLDSTPDPGEGPVDGIEFCLYDADDNLISCKTTPESGEVVWTDLMPGDYTVVEKPRPGWFPTGPTEVPLTLQSGDVEQVDFGNVANCVGLTPGYWKNWRNHYTAAQFEVLLAGTIAMDIAAADLVFAEYDASNPQDLTILKAFVLANQLTLNLTLHPELPNPSQGSLFLNCTLRDYPDEMTLGNALDRLLTSSHAAAFELLIRRRGGRMPSPSRTVTLGECSRLNNRNRVNSGTNPPENCLLHQPATGSTCRPECRCRA